VKSKHIAWRLYLLTTVSALLLTAAGCSGEMNVFPKMSEVADLEIVQALGIDRTEDGLIEVTIVANTTSASSGEGSGEESLEVVSVCALTVNEAVAELNIKTDKRQHFGSVDYLLIGEAAARDDIVKHFDYFTRDHESRFSAKVFIVRDSTVKDLLSKTASVKQRNIIFMLENFDETVRTGSSTLLMPAIELVSMLDSETGIAVVPAIKYQEYEHAQDEETAGVTITPAGYSIIKDFKLTDYIEPDIAMGYNILTGELNNAPMSVETEDGCIVSLEILREKIRFDTFWDDGLIRGVKFQIYVRGSIVGQSGRANITTPDRLAEIEEKAASQIRETISSVLIKTREIGRDCLGIGDRIRMKNPVKWDGIADEWNDIYDSIEIEADVSFLVLRSYDINEPNGYYASNGSGESETGRSSEGREEDESYR